MTAAPALAGRAAVVRGLGVYAPPRVVTNDELAQRLDTTDEWVRTRTGIAQRHIADAGTSTGDLAAEAAIRAVKSAGGDEPDAVIVATTTPDRLCPATAPEVVTRMGLRHVAAFDVGAVCSGFVYGLAVGTGLIAAGVTRRVVVVGAETIGRFLNPQDRSTSVIFGDGAGAVVLGAGNPDELGALGPFDLGSDGAGSDLIAVAAGGSRRPASDATIDVADHYLRMDGREVYRHAIPRMVESCKVVLDRAGWPVDSVDRFVGHQANVRILDGVADRLGIPAERRVVNIDRYGNTSAASIPLALADADLQPGHRVLLTAFGGGLTWGSTLLRWPEITPA
ncbi:MAG: ketoacyl-ACP synthase III [Actinomycetota bacterium]|nr:ketoacyl-ACP synthase III [Actinomycetota bacterium]